MKQYLGNFFIKNKHKFLLPIYSFLGVNGFTLICNQVFDSTSISKKYFISSSIGIFLGSWIGKLLDDKNLIIFNEKKKIQYYLKN